MRSTFLDPGQMSARLNIEAPQETPDGQGGVTSTFVETASVWALIASPASSSARAFACTWECWRTSRSVRWNP